MIVLLWWLYFSEHRECFVFFVLTMDIRLNLMDIYVIYQNHSYKTNTPLTLGWRWSKTKKKLDEFLGEGGYFFIFVAQNSLSTFCSGIYVVRAKNFPVV